MPAPNPSTRPRRRQAPIKIPAASRIAIAILTARPAGSGHGTGSLKNTMMPSPENWSSALDQFSGDGIMVFFNDPVPCPDPAGRAVKMAMAMREAAGILIGAWRRRGRVLGFGAGIAQGYATLGQIGFADRSGYTAIGTVCNLAARLCAE